MGSAASQELSRGLSNFKPVGSRNLSYFGGVEVLYYRLQNEYILMKRISSDIFSKAQLKTVDALINLSHPNFLLFHGVKQIDEKDYEIYFENIVWTLEDEISRRKEKKEYFTNDEIFAILNQAASALAYFQQHNIPHGGMTTQALLLATSGGYKIVHPLLIGRHQSNRDSIKQLSRFLPPNISISSKLETPSDPFKDDAYALAITIIDACLLGFTGNPIEQRMDLVRRGYSAVIWMILEKMIEISEHERIDSLTLDYILRDETIRSSIKNDIHLKQRLAELLSKAPLRTNSVSNVRRTIPSYQTSPVPDRENKFSSSYRHPTNVSFEPENVSRNSSPLHGRIEKTPSTLTPEKYSRGSFKEYEVNRYIPTYKPSQPSPLKESRYSPSRTSYTEPGKIYQNRTDRDLRPENEKPTSEWNRFDKYSGTNLKYEPLARTLFSNESRPTAMRLPSREPYQEVRRQESSYLQSPIRKKTESPVSRSYKGHISSKPYDQRIYEKYLFTNSEPVTSSKFRDLAKPQPFTDSDILPKRSAESNYHERRKVEFEGPFTSIGREKDFSQYKEEIPGVRSPLEKREVTKDTLNNEKRSWQRPNEFVELNKGLYSPKRYESGRAENFQTPPPQTTIYQDPRSARQHLRSPSSDYATQTKHEEVKDPKAAISRRYLQERFTDAKTGASFLSAANDFLLSTFSPKKDQSYQAERATQDREFQSKSIISEPQARNIPSSYSESITYSPNLKDKNNFAQEIKLIDSSPKTYSRNWGAQESDLLSENLKRREGQGKLWQSADEKFKNVSTVHEVSQERQRMEGEEIKFENKPIHISGGIQFSEQRDLRKSETENKGDFKPERWQYSEDLTSKSKESNDGDEEVKNKSTTAQDTVSPDVGKESS